MMRKRQPSFSHFLDVRGKWGSPIKSEKARRSAGWPNSFADGLFMVKTVRIRRKAAQSFPETTGSSPLFHAFSEWNPFIDFEVQSARKVEISQEGLDGSPSPSPYGFKLLSKNRIKVQAAARAGTPLKGEIAR